MTVRNPVEFVDSQGRRTGNEVVLATGAGQPLLTDGVVGALTIVDSVHHEVHEGAMFIGEYSATVGNGNNLDIRLLTGASETHITIELNVGGQSTLTIYEAATISVGTGLAVYNMKRTDLTHTAPFQMWHTPTVTATGTTAIVNGRLLAGGTSPQTRVGTGSRPGLEWIFKPATEYLIRVNNSSGGNIVISVVVNGYTS